jgi:hypothetical protein
MARYCYGEGCGIELTPENSYDPSRGICKECHKKRVNARRAALRLKGLCIACGEPAEAGSPTCADCKKNTLQNYYANRDDYLATQKRRRHQLKLEAFAAYGGAFCSCCGETHLEFLSIDHAAGDGAEHRRQLAKARGWNTPSTSMAGSQMYLWLKQQGYPSGFRVLCFNCNFAEAHGGCPHERERQAAASLATPPTSTLAQETGT